VDERAERAERTRFADLKTRLLILELSAQGLRDVRRLFVCF
jgi:hypothetical protein